MDDHVALILAAGKGTRMKSDLPKVLHRLAGRSMVRYVVDNARESGARRVVAVIGHGAALVREELAASGVEFVLQARQLGTGHAVLAARDALLGYAGDLLILSGDVPLLAAETIGRLLELHRRTESGCTLMTTVEEDPAGYGRIIKGGDGMVERIVEKADATPEELRIREVNTGIYCFRSGLLFEMLERCGNENAQGEYYLTDVVAAVRAGGLPVQALTVDDHVQVRGVNNRAELAGLAAVLNGRKLERLMLDGVTILAPETTRVDWDVQVGRDTVIHPHTCLQGTTRVGACCILHPFTLLRDAVLGDRVTVGPHTVVDGQNLEDGSAVGL